MGGSRGRRAVSQTTDCRGSRWTWTFALRAATVIGPQPKPRRCSPGCRHSQLPFQPTAELARATRRVVSAAGLAAGSRLGSQPGPATPLRRRISTGGNKPYCHWLDKATYDIVSDPTDYSDSAWT